MKFKSNFKYLITLLTLLFLCGCESKTKTENLYDDFVNEFYKLENIQNEYKFVNAMIQQPLDITPPKNSKLDRFYSKYKDLSPEQLNAAKTTLNKAFDDQYKVTLTKFVYFKNEVHNEGLELLIYEDFKTSRINETPFYYNRGVFPIQINRNFYSELKNEFIKNKNATN